MTRLILLVLALPNLSGCVLGYAFYYDFDYPAKKYRCYEISIDKGVDVPPVPNCKENNKTLAGIDSDNDGVRDDLQRYIAALDIDHPYFIRSLTQYARALQKTMLEHDREELAQKNFVLLSLAVDCSLSANLPPNNFGDEFDISDELRDVHLNTFKRRSAHSHWRSFLETQLVPSVGSDTACNFDTSKFKGKRLQ